MQLASNENANYKGHGIGKRNYGRRKEEFKIFTKNNYRLKTGLCQIAEWIQVVSMSARVFPNVHVH